MADSTEAKAAAAEGKGTTQRHHGQEAHRRDCEIVIVCRPPFVRRQPSAVCAPFIIIRSLNLSSDEETNDD